MLARLARIRCVLDRLDDADELVERVRRMGASNVARQAAGGDRPRPSCWRAAAITLRPRSTSAPRLRSPRRPTSSMTGADAYADLAEVLPLGGKADEATEALEQALERYERKERLVMARRTRDRLAAEAAHT